VGSTSIQLPPHPAPLAWEVSPVSWAITAGALQVTAGPRTDMFVSPSGEAPTLNAPRLLGPIAGDFQLSARVTVDFQGTYDAGVLLVWSNEQSWAKLCFEYSPQRDPMIVSVVTRVTSDDANSFVVGLLMGDAPLVGFEAQSPVGEGCGVRFEDIRYSPTRLGELRSGE
jgi:regulation of enolase protein 1 (concanavalin A-like superfamily)